MTLWWRAGVDAVRIMPLAKKLKLSRTSFYWFFKDREELLAALSSVASEEYRQYLKRTEAYAESIAEAILNVFDCWLDSDLFDSQFEFAVRVGRSRHRRSPRKSVPPIARVSRR